MIPLVAHAFLPVTHDFDRFRTMDDVLREYLYDQLKTDEDREKWMPGQNGVRHLVLTHHKDGKRLILQRQQERQAEINRCLAAILDGVDPRVVFKLGPRKKRGDRGATGRNQAIAMEVLRLELIEGMDPADAKEAVCQLYAMHDKQVDLRTVQSAVKKWRNHPAFTIDWVKRYADMLRLDKYID